MHAIRIHKFGGPEVLALDDLPVPEPGPGEARVRIEASGLNFIDIYQRTGAYRGALPLTLGQEAAGVVDSAGTAVAEVKAGDRVVYASVMGADAQYAVVPAWRLVPVPPGVLSQQAVAVMLQGLTAHYLTHSTYPLRAGETALVHAAAGGVGQLLVQICKHLGARVFGTVSNDAKAQIARDRGADEVILYTQVDFESEVKRLTGGKGVDVVYDSVGKDTFDKSLDCLRPRGYMVLCGQSSGAVAPLDPQLLNANGSLFLTRPTLGHYTATRDELRWRANDLFEWMRAGRLKVTIDKTFPLAQAAEAHRYLQSRQAMGKVLLIP